MKIDAEMVDYIARLSRLELQPGEKRAMTEELERIVAYMDVLDRLDTQGVEPMSHVFPVKNVLREAMSLSWWFKEEPAEFPGFSRIDLG